MKYKLKFNTLYIKIFFFFCEGNQRSLRYHVAIASKNQTFFLYIYIEYNECLTQQEFDRDIKQKFKMNKKNNVLNKCESIDWCVINQKSINLRLIISFGCVCFMYAMLCVFLEVLLDRYQQVFEICFNYFLVNWSWWLTK